MLLSLYSRLQTNRKKCPSLQWLETTSIAKIMIWCIFCILKYHRHIMILCNLYSTKQNKTQFPYTKSTTKISRAERKMYQKNVTLPTFTCNWNISKHDILYNLYILSINNDEYWLQERLRISPKVTKGETFCYNWQFWVMNVISFIKHNVPY